MSHSSSGLSAPSRSSADRILVYLKMHGAQTSAALGKALEITGEAVRQQLQRLAGDGVVHASPQAGGVGRPALQWRLTRAGHERFPDSHSTLLVRVLEGVVAEFGEAGLEKLLEARQSQARHGYVTELHEADLSERVEGLARIRTREGYMCETEAQADGAWLLVENHCPICTAAAACPKLCQSELELFREVMGPDARVERVEHLQSGDRRCVYRIHAVQAES